MAEIVGNEVLENSDVARDLWNKSQFGSKQGKGTICFSPLEALYLLELEKITITQPKGYDFSKAFKKFMRTDKQLAQRYAVYKELRSRGYVVKTALKFGADFRVYEKGSKPGETHAKWVVFAVRETHSQSWQAFSAKNRVAHSTKKKLLIGVVDDESDVTFFEVGWVKP